MTRVSGISLTFELYPYAVKLISIAVVCTLIVMQMWYAFLAVTQHFGNQCCYCAMTVPQTQLLNT